MSAPQQQAARGGIGIFGLLTIVFVIAKIWGAIDWSWWLVFLPLYGIPAAFIAVALLVGVVWLLFTAGVWVAPYVYRLAKRIRR